MYFIKTITGINVLPLLNTIANGGLCLFGGIHWVNKFQFQFGLKLRVLQNYQLIWCNECFENILFSAFPLNTELVLIKNDYTGKCIASRPGVYFLVECNRFDPSQQFNLKNGCIKPHFSDLLDSVILNNMISYNPVTTFPLAPLTSYLKRLDNFIEK